MRTLVQDKPQAAQEELALFSVLAHAVFPGRTVLYCKEVAAATGTTPRHICDLCAEGTIKGAFNVGGEKNQRNVHFWRIPVSAYDLWIRQKSNLDLGKS